MTSHSRQIAACHGLVARLLTITGQRFELAMFLKDPALESQVIAGALAHGDPKLVTLAQDWLRDTGKRCPR